jgi:hypothetical protein
MIQFVCLDVHEPLYLSLDFLYYNFFSLYHTHYFKKCTQLIMGLQLEEHGSGPIKGNLVATQA